MGGVGTGVKLAPPYACIGMGEFENIAFDSNNNLLEALLLWKRYIDDVLGLYKGSEEEFQNLVDWLNSLMRGVIKFKCNYSQEKVEFLDLVISKENGKLKTNLFIKPSNLQLYLDFHSNHPMHCKVGIIYGQALRIVERCSDEGDVHPHLENLKGKLLCRNYPENLIDQQFSRAKKKTRREIIYQKRRPKNAKDEKVRLIFTHNEGNPPLHQWLRETRKLLVRNEKARKLGDNIQIAFRQPRNLKNLATGFPSGGRGATQPNAGCSKCKKCHACKVLKEGKSFTSTNTGKKYPIRQEVTCNSSYIVYLGTCKKCRGQYVGKSTQPFKRRHSGHKSEIKNQIGGLGHHYGGPNGCGYENMSVIIIEQVEVGNPTQLAQRETFWQSQLRCYVENGKNGHCYRKEM